MASTPEGDTGETPVIVHLAGRAGVMESWQSPLATYCANIVPTATVLDSGRRHNAHVIFVSSYLYGMPQHLPINEEHPIAPANPYARSKHFAEELCRAYAEDFGLNVTVLRLFNIFGPGQPDSQVVPHIVNQAINGETISVADMAPRRDYLWVDDFVDALVCTIDTPGTGFNVFNVGYGRSHSVGELIDLVAEIAGPIKSIDRAEHRQGEIPDCVCDNTKFRKFYDWHPKVDLRTGLERMFAAGHAS